MIVGYIHPREGLHHGNLRWLGTWPMARGKFLPGHPAAPGSPVVSAAGGGQLGDSPDLRLFRMRGYWASCFPEGDGITFQLPDPSITAEQGAERRAYVEAKERAATGKCSKIIRFSVFCTRAIGHDGGCVHEPTPPPVRVKKPCCPRCGNWLLPGRAHTCGDRACL